MAIRKHKNGSPRRIYGLLVEAGMVAALLLLILAFRINIQPEYEMDFTIDQVAPVEVIDIPRTEQPRKPPKPPRPRIVVEVENDVLIDEDEELDLDPYFDIQEPQPLGDPPEPDPEPKPEEPDLGPDIFVVVEEMPELIGKLGPIRYPEMARRAGVEGSVTVQFVVDENGHVTEPEVFGPRLGGGCDEEALRVVSEAKFKPGKQRGKAVKVRFHLRVTFRLR